jgi:hypothetical protein
MLALPLVTMVAIVTGDATPLRAAAHDTAARQTLLWPGDWVELRGERQGWLQVYDHRHERPGYLRPSQVRIYAEDALAARDLAAVLDFVRDQPGLESVGIGLVALFLRAAPPSAIGGEVFDALGGMAERLARRASSRWARPGDVAIGAQIDVAESYGVHFVSFERAGRTRVCYDGEAHRRVLALPSPPAARARAALALTDPLCVDPARPAVERASRVAWQNDVLAQVDPRTFGTAVPAWLTARLRIRRAALQAQLAYARARVGDGKGAAAAAEAADNELTLVERTEMADEDGPAYDEAALSVGAVRWAAAPPAPTAARGLTVEIAAGKPGETCLRAGAFQHCTFAVVWPASLRIAPRGDAVAVAQSPLPGWTELVLLRRARSGWHAEVIAPAAVEPELGTVELAGWSPDGSRLLLARAARVTGPLGQPGTQAPYVQRRFQIVRADGLGVEKQSDRLENFPTFRRWASADFACCASATRR